MKIYLRKFAGTFIAAFLLILLGGYIYFSEVKKPDEAKVKEKEKVFTGINKKQVTEVTFKFPSYTISCKKEGQNWFVVTDSNKFRSDNKAISELIDNLSNLEIERVATNNPADLPLYGLDSPRLEINIKTPQEEYDLFVGVDSPVTSGIYVRPGNDIRVLIVPRAAIEGFLGKSVNDLRSKQILSLEESEVNKLRFKSGSTSFEIEKNGDTWESVNIPQYIHIDQDRVASILRTFLNLKVTSFEEGAAKDLTPYGLKKPSAEIEIIQNEKSTRILLGKKKEDGTYYMKLSSGDSVYTVEEAAYYSIPSGLSDIRLMKFIDMNIDGVTGIEIRRGETTTSLSKQENNWKIKYHGDKTVNEQRVMQLLKGIEKLYSEEFLSIVPKDLSPFGLYEPYIEITITEDGKETTFYLGSQKDGKVFAMISGKRAVYRISDEILALIPASSDDLIIKN